MVIFLAQANPFSIHEKETEEPFSLTSKIVRQYNAHHSIGLSCQIALIELYITSLTGCLNPNWHEARYFYPPCNFEIGFCQLNLFQKFPNFFGGEN